MLINNYIINIKINLTNNFVINKKYNVLIVLNLIVSIVFTLLHVHLLLARLLCELDQAASFVSLICKLEEPISFVIVLQISCHAGRLRSSLGTDICPILLLRCMTRAARPGTGRRGTALI